MLEVRYNLETKVVTGWCSDEDQFGNLGDRDGREALIILDIDSPPKPCRAFLYDETAECLIDNPDYPQPQPPRSIHLARLSDINPDKVRPATAVRTWEDRDYTYDCFVTQTIKDQWIAGDIVIGDIVLVEFLEDTSDRAIVVHKVFKTW